MPDDLGATLLARVAGAQREDLLALVRDIERARDAALQRLLAGPVRLLALDEAAQLLSMPERRLRSLARGKPWALYVGRALRIDAEKMIAWSRCKKRAANATEPAPI